MTHFEQRALHLLLLPLLLAACAPAAPPTSPPRTIGAKPTTGPAGSTRVVRHAMSETQMPANPRRVVVLDTSELDSAFGLGVTSVGAVTVLQNRDFQAYLRPKAERIR